MSRRWKLPDAAERAAAQVLRRELGLLRLLRTAARLAKLQKAGEPFAHLPPPDCQDEVLSREQIGPAILLYRILRESHPRGEALRIAEAVAVASGAVTMRENLGDLRRDRLLHLSDEERMAYVRRKGSRFFNSTMRWDEVSTEAVRFTVTACRFPRLCQATGVPELAPIFCRVDEGFFGKVEPNVRLIRPHTIAEGAETCPFELRWVGEGGGDGADRG